MFSKLSPSHLGAMLAGAFLFLTGASAHARLGEPEAVLSLRFGTPTQTIDHAVGEGRAVKYEKDGLIVWVIFLDGRSVYEIYTKLSLKELSQLPKGFRFYGADDVQTVLDLNGKGQKWFYVEAFKLDKKEVTLANIADAVVASDWPQAWFELEDKSIEASLSSDTLSIYYAAAIERLKKK